MPDIGLEHSVHKIIVLSPFIGLFFFASLHLTTESYVVCELTWVFNNNASNVYNLSNTWSGWVLLFLIVLGK